jgi:hypothetical protein
MGGTLTSILRPSILVSSTKAAVDQARGLIYRPSTSRICSRSQSHSARITASLPRSVCASFSMGIARIMCSLEHIPSDNEKIPCKQSQSLTRRRSVRGQAVELRLNRF